MKKIVATLIAGLFATAAFAQTPAAAPAAESAPAAQAAVKETKADAKEAKATVKHVKAKKKHAAKAAAAKTEDAKDTTVAAAPDAAK